jgi:hypothetical protein
VSCQALPALETAVRRESEGTGARLILLFSTQLMKIQGEDLEMETGKLHCNSH